MYIYIYRDGFIFDLNMLIMDIIDIKIIENDRVNPIFIKVNSFLFKKYQETYFQIVLDKKSFENLWFEEVGVILEYDEILCTWTAMKFLSEKERTAFTLKWGC